MGVVMDLVTRLPVEIWFEENPNASDTRFEEKLLELVSLCCHRFISKTLAD
jgi:hypothetical protein